MRELVTAIAQFGEFERAEALARTIANVDAKARALGALATAAAHVGDAARFHRLASDAEALARTIVSPDAQAWALSALATAAAQVHDLIALGIYWL